MRGWWSRSSACIFGWCLPYRRPNSVSNGCGRCSLAKALAHRPGLRHRQLPPKRMAMRQALLPYLQLRLRSPQGRSKRRLGQPGSQTRTPPKAVIVRGRGAWGPRPIPGPRAPSAATRSWRWDSAARCAGRGRSMRCPLGWRYASTAMPCSVPCAMRSKSCAARRAGRSLRQGCPLAWGQRNTAPRPGRYWR
jgi:hypothetical protein